ncbi:MBL fold metallo-hydrolase [Euzebya pacifica]|jgi:glyoxylase-like metal-dependent hydrolase (beta-lactamase superfamily II)|uniref:MBL fold metallo-hydrolase n=1 Tax=Euzebya pacifica TaxID=1608957 RepID=UPI0030FBAF43
MSAELTILFEGYVGPRVAGTVSLVRDGDRVIVHDPGMVPGPSSILDPLQAADIHPEEVTDLVISHHHPDHTRWMGLFPIAVLHDYWASYDGDVWDSRPAEGVQLTPSVTLLETPGHTREDITTLVETDAGTVALTHLWWTASSESDPRGTDLDALHQHRARVLERAVRIVPGHGPAFDVSDETPR